MHGFLVSHHDYGDAHFRDSGHADERARADPDHGRDGVHGEIFR